MGKEAIKNIIKRNGNKVEFDKKLIFSALEKAFYAMNESDLVLVASLTDQVLNDLVEKSNNETTIHVESVQDTVEEILMKNGHYKVAKAYIIYRETHKSAREEQTIEEIKDGKLTLSTTKREEVFNPELINLRLSKLSFNLNHIDIQSICENSIKQVYKGITKEELNKIVLGSIRKN